METTFETGTFPCTHRIGLLSMGLQDAQHKKKSKTSLTELINDSIINIYIDNRTKLTTGKRLKDFIEIFFQKLPKKLIIDSLHRNNRAIKLIVKLVEKMKYNHGISLCSEVECTNLSGAIMQLFHQYMKLLLPNLSKSLQKDTTSICRNASQNKGCYPPSRNATLL